MKIFVYGAPGAGKTTFSFGLKSKLKYPIVEADYLREHIVQMEKTKEQEPFAYVGTKEAWRLFGELNKENTIKGLKGVRECMLPDVLEEIGLYPDNLILEAAFLDPASMTAMGKLALIVTLDKEKHRQQYFEHREKSEHNIETFSAVRMVQDFLIEEAKQYQVTVLENGGNIPELIDQFTA